LLIEDRGLHECFSLATGKKFAIGDMVVGLLLGCVACIRAKEHQEAFCRFVDVEKSGEGGGSGGSGGSGVPAAEATVSSRRGS
jgi:threonine dehydrogenase-like Zn-dependent dehydrogenase